MGVGEGRISSLPDKLLHYILIRLGSARDAVRTGVLSRTAGATSWTVRYRSSSSMAILMHKHLRLWSRIDISYFQRNRCRSSCSCRFQESHKIDDIFSIHLKR
ncbi:hypothetical protein HU200_048654 [Digitaria exilis]|uniref:F-box domain-containing protein n=1 Tax=Digitaria exilis TaxID=1010633 RepID=A0A835ECT4_9POAL|nr:hypothetical protein HU200_048654 [Digitaria exilis]